MAPECNQFWMRGATARRGVWYCDFNTRKRRKGSGDRVGGGRIGRMGRRDRDSWRVRAGGRWYVGTWGQGERGGEGDHMEGVDVGSEQPRL